MQASLNQITLTIIRAAHDGRSLRHLAVMGDLVFTLLKTAFVAITSDVIHENIIIAPTTSRYTVVRFDGRSLGSSEESQKLISVWKTDRRGYFMIIKFYQ